MPLTSYRIYILSQYRNCTFNAVIDIRALPLAISMATFSTFKSAPEWKTFASPTGDRYTIGLWSACRNGVCTYAWSSYTPMVSVNPMTGRLQPVLYYQDATPSLIMYIFVWSIACISCACSTFNSDLQQYCTGLHHDGSNLAPVRNVLLD